MLKIVKKTVCFLNIYIYNMYFFVQQIHTLITDYYTFLSQKRVRILRVYRKYIKCIIYYFRFFGRGQKLPTFHDFFT